MSNAFIDAIQAASNSAAGIVTGPVDLIALALRKSGVPVSDAPIGSSAWAERVGLMRPVSPGPAQVIGETAGLLAPVAAASKAVPGLLANLAYRPKAGLLGALDNAESAARNAYRSAKIRDPNPLPQRPFLDDYQGIPTGAASGERLAFDIEGRALNPSATVFGRRVVGGVDKGALRGDAGSIADALGIPVTRVPAREIGGDAGAFLTIPGTILDPRIKISNALDDATAESVLRHELGHAIDKTASKGARCLWTDSDADPACEQHGLHTPGHNPGQ